MITILRLGWLYSSCRPRPHYGGRRSRWCGGVSEQDVTWEAFQRYFKEKYLTERFYDEKAREFHDLRLGQHTIDEFITKFTSLLHCVPYIREERAKVQWFVRSLPLAMRERIYFDNPKTMDEAIRKARLCYQ